MAQKLRISLEPPLEDIEEERPLSSDPIVSSDFASFQPSRSRPRPEVSSMGVAGIEAGPSNANENDPLLGSGKPRKKPFYRARPLW